MNLHEIAPKPTELAVGARVRILYRNWDLHGTTGTIMRATIYGDFEVTLDTIPAAWGMRTIVLSAKYIELI